MSIQERRQRERAHRHDLIISAARNLAETEGWDAVTTRRLAEIVEYSQPVLYSHFDGKDAIVRAVAVEGFGELADALALARSDCESPKAALRAVCSAYLAFATNRPALYHAMFVLPLDVQFASDETPPALKAAFAELYGALAPFDPQPSLLTEVTWAALHGLAVLCLGGRIPAQHQDARIDLLISQIATRNDLDHQGLSDGQKRRITGNAKVL